MLDCLLGLYILMAARFDYFPPEPETATLVFTGDNKIQGRTVRRIGEHGESYPYAEVTDVLTAADITFGNLECPITDYPYSTLGKSWESIQAGINFVFKAPPEYSARILADAGYDVLSLANNHMMDYRANGLEQTLTELDVAGLIGVGAGTDEAAAAAPIVIEHGNVKVGYLAYSLIVPPYSRADEDEPGINTLPQQYTAKLGQDIGALHEEADVVVCSFHWGKESSTVVAKYQRDIAHAAIDAGADLIIGHHPHCLQGFEFYGDGLIAYSLGNFLFTGKSHKLASCILEVNAGADGLISTRLLPVWVIDGRPEPSTDTALLAQIERVCSSLDVELVQCEDGWIELRSVIADDAQEETQPNAK